MILLISFMGVSIVTLNKENSSDHAIIDLPSISFMLFTQLGWSLGVIVINKSKSSTY